MVRAPSQVAFVNVYDWARCVRRALRASALAICGSVTLRQKERKTFRQSGLILHSVAGHCAFRLHLRARTWCEALSLHNLGTDIFQIFTFLEMSANQLLLDVLCLNLSSNQLSLRISRLDLFWN